ncbi:alpha/beta hydrolase family protein [Sphingomicrobium marinum]|uniref:alpha/beta hydrolase family protein n=1 Tax=Sphingomicrobium marinum TaxID=1227950 RepID=UPI00223FFB2D|nr:alpha/beta fold hydrolase [Sphingomicrobium marinum]
MKSFWLAGIAAFAAATAQAQAMPLKEAAEKFGQRSSAWGAQLSPSGSRIVYLSAGEGASTVVYVYDVASNTARAILSSEGDPESLYWCDFASEERLICQFGGVEEWNGEIIPFTRLISIGADGSDPKGLGARQRSSTQYVWLSDGGILDWLPDLDGEVLMTRHYAPEAGRTGSRISDDTSGTTVERIDVDSLKARTIERPAENIAFYRTDGRGNVRIRAVRRVRAGQMTGEYSMQYREPGSDKWLDLGTYDSTDNSGPFPLAVDADTNMLYHLEALDGRDALYRRKLDGSSERELVAAHDRVDIDGVVRLDNGQRVVGYSYEDDEPTTVYFDDDVRSLRSALSRAIEGDPMIGYASTTVDGNKVIVRATSDTDPGYFWLFDKQAKTLDPLFAARAPLEGVDLAPVKAIEYQAADGTSIPAYLTMSADGPQTGRPAVVLPHGGPSSRDRWGFDWLPQFLAARGYAVIQPNFRGSSGYGADFLGDNAFRDWQTAMSDIASSADYLASSGIADPGKIAILGWSYGGYAALQSAALDPDTYKAVVAIAPVTDIIQLRSDARRSFNSKLVRDMVGGGANARTGSPINNASKIKAPVLLVHGDMDLNVDKDHSIRMEDALSDAGKQVELIRFDKLEHQLDDSAARIEMLTKIGELLDRTIGS